MVEIENAEPSSCAAHASCEETARRPRRGIGTVAQRRLGTHLRTMYETVLNQEVPDRFTQLIARLGEDEPVPEGVDRS